MSARVGFDVGGTFTDFVLHTASGDLLTAKRLTTYPDPTDACLPGLDELLAAHGIAWSDVTQAVHGTTLGSNIVIERKARGVGLLTTRGFRDVLIIGREKRYQVYDLQIEKPAPLLPRRLIGAIERHLSVPIKTLDQVVDAVLAPRHVAELLGLRPRSPVLLFERTYYAASGEPVEHAVTYQAGRRYPYRVVLSRAERRP